MASAVIGALRVNLGLDSAQFQQGLKSAQSGMKKFGATMKQGAMAAGAAMLTAGAGISMAVKGILDNADELTKAAQKIGVPVDELTRLKHAAELSGVSLSGLQTSMGRLSRVMNDAKNGSKEAVDSFAQIGVSATNADGSLRSSSDVLAEIADKFAAMPDGAEKTALAMELMGRSGADMIPMLNGGADALQKMKDEADALGIVFSPEMGKQAEQFNDNLDRLSKVFGGIMTQIAAAAAGPLAQFTDWLVEMAKSFSEMSPWLKDAVTRFGLLSAALAVIGAPLALVAAGIAAIGVPVAAAAAGIIAITAAVVAFWPEIQRLGEAIGTFLAGAWASFEAAWDGIVAKVDSVKAAVVQFAADLLQSFAELPAQMLQIGSDIIAGLWNGITAKWEEVKGGISNIGSGIAGTFKSVLGIQSPSRVMHAVGVNIMQGLSNGMDSMAGGVEGGVTTVADGIANAFSGIGSGIADAIKGTKSWKDVALDAIRSIGSALLSNMSFGGGFFGSLFKGLLGGLTGFKDGGSFTVGGAGGTDSQLVAFRASPGEMVDVRKGGQARHGAGGYAPVYNIDARGADAAAISRLEAGLKERDRRFGQMVDHRINTSQTRGTRP